MSDEDKIQHTVALNLCAKLTSLQSDISSLQHDLVLHYSAINVPSYKTKGAVDRLSRTMDGVEEQLDKIRRELEELDR